MAKTGRSAFVFLAAFIICCSAAGVAAAEKGVPLASHLRQRYTDDLDGLLRRRYVRVLTTFNRTNFFIAGGKQYGFEYSLLRDYEKFLNRKIKRKDLRVVLEFIPVARDRLLPMLMEGYGDIAAASLTVTPARLSKVDFTIPYLHGIDEVVVAHRDVKGLRSVYDLAGRKVYVRKSSNYYESLIRLNTMLREKGLRPVEIVTADETLETEDILELVNSGAVGITISDSHIAGIWSKIFKDLRVYRTLAIRKDTKIAWAVRKNNPELRRSLSAFLRTHKKGTLLGNIYFNRYYRNTRWIRNPLSKSERAKIERYKRLFRKYASRYGFDWMLIMAQAYQESGLDNTRRNPSGAVGVMQVLPRTAADRNIGITGIEKLENNIHAGVKYLAFLRDRYFTTKGLRERDRIRFALAAYNAGPAKVRRARALAKKMGLDPDRWFRNVEMAMLRMVGQETVRYVSNINKYYILFRSYFERERLRREKKSETAENP